MRPITFMAAVLICTSPVWLLAMSGRAEEVQPPSVSTSGEAVVYVAPDEVVVSFGIETFDPDLDKAKSLNDDRAGRLVKAVKALGVEQKFIQTDNLHVELSYRSNRPREGIAGYVARRAYSVTLKDVKQFEKLVDTGLKNGANQLQGFTFRSTQMRKYRDQPRAMAAKAAKEKAEALAKELNCSVGLPRHITEGYAGAFGGYNTANFAQNAMQFTPATGGDSDDIFPPGQLAIRAQISVVFDLRQ